MSFTRPFHGAKTKREGRRLVRDVFLLGKRRCLFKGERTSFELRRICLDPRRHDISDLMRDRLLCKLSA